MINIPKQVLKNMGSVLSPEFKGKKRFHPQSWKELLLFIIIIFPIVFLYFRYRLGDFWIDPSVNLFWMLLIIFGYTGFVIAWILGLTRFYDLLKSFGD